MSRQGNWDQSHWFSPAPAKQPTVRPFFPHKTIDHPSVFSTRSPVLLKVTDVHVICGCFRSRMANTTSYIWFCDKKVKWGRYIYWNIHWSHKNTQLNWRRGSAALKSWRLRHCCLTSCGLWRQKLSLLGETSHTGWWLARAGEQQLWAPTRHLSLFSPRKIPLNAPHPHPSF